MLSCQNFSGSKCYGRSMLHSQWMLVLLLVEKLQSNYLESVNACSGVKMQQYLHLRSASCRFGKLHSSCLSAGCWRMAAAQAFGTTPNWIALVGSGDGSLWECKSRAGSKTAWCKSSWWRWAHDIWLCCNGCWAAEAPVVVWASCSGRLFLPGPNRICCFCARLLQGLHRVMSNSGVLFIHRCWVRRPVGGYVKRPEMASNRLRDTSIIRLCPIFDFYSLHR